MSLASYGIRQTLTRDERDEVRQNAIRRIGYDPTISESVADAIREKISTLWHIQREEFTGFRLQFSVVPLMDSRFRQLHDMESALMKEYGNDPYRLATKFSQYTLQFFAN